MGVTVDISSRKSALYYSWALRSLVPRPFFCGGGLVYTVRACVNYAVKYSGSRKAKYAAQKSQRRCACSMGRFCEVCLPAVEPIDWKET